MNNEFNLFSPQDIDKFAPEIFHLFNKQWFLLVAGDYASGDYNCMTVSWGMLGTIWNKPMAMAMSRPQRHTRKFLDKYQEFTLCAFPEEHRDKLKFCGVKSGKDYKNKLIEAGFTPYSIQNTHTIGCKEASLIICCKKIQKQTLNGETLPIDIVNNFYPEKDFHELYLGEITQILSTNS